jgi:hypothetical protein
MNRSPSRQDSGRAATSARAGVETQRAPGALRPEPDRRGTGEPARTSSTHDRPAGLSSRSPSLEGLYGLRSSGRSSGSGFILRRAPSHDVARRSGSSALLRPPSQRRGRPGLAPGSLFTPSPLSGAGGQTTTSCGCSIGAYHICGQGARCGGWAGSGGRGRGSAVGGDGSGASCEEPEAGFRGRSAVDMVRRQWIDSFYSEGRPLRDRE